MHSFNLKTNTRTELIDITRQIQEVVSQSAVRNGVATIYIPHTTAAITINENADPDVKRDILFEINKLIPFEDNYHHTEGNAAAHIKASLLGASQTIIIADGRLKLGTWQGVFFCEFDGPRSRNVWMHVMGE